MSLPALALVLVGLAIMELVWRRIRRTRESGAPFSGVAFDEFTAFLHGSKRVELDQRVTQSLMREEEQDGAPPHLIDLDRGVVFLNRPDGDSKN
ncbi:DUF6191 domain-containing protein [Kibdelosporangium persicum]|uniref:DUF6191 domain-containing protein n=1 Tax=Kibdelosporangium persicum TaxID=2698649 RepID=UPI001563545A|nr:DUF6191 domain-containing protein [Kibdelosporangium persicum]